MAKSRSFFGIRTGSTKSMTFQNLNGVQITKDRVYDVKNPRSLAQQIQRSRLAYIGKFYKHAVKNFFPFAFENKKQTESDYNAFVRENMDLTPYASKQMLDNEKTLFLAPYLMTQGSLPSLDNCIAPLGAGNLYMFPSFEDYVSDVQESLAYATLADLSQFLINSKMCELGDIVTVVRTKAGEDSTFNAMTSADVIAAGALYNTGEEAPEWNISQFYCDPAADGNERRCIGFLSGLTIQDDQFIFDGMSGPQAACVVVSRKTEDGLKVSTTHLVLNRYAQLAVSLGYTAAWSKYAATAFGEIGTEAILKGAIAEENTNAKLSILTAPVAINTDLKSLAGKMTFSRGTSLEYLSQHLVIVTDGIVMASVTSAGKVVVGETEYGTVALSTNGKTATFTAGGSATTPKVLGFVID